MRACRRPLWLVKPGPMPETPVILAAVDPVHSHDKPAALDGSIVRHAADIAGRTGGQVELLHTYDLVAGIGSAATREFKPIRIAVDKIDEKMRKEHRDKLDTLARRHGIDPAHVHQIAGAARELIPGYARQIGANLVVMGALARWGLKRAIIGSTAERVLDQLHCDILIVRKPGSD